MVKKVAQERGQKVDNLPDNGVGDTSASLQNDRWIKTSFDAVKDLFSPNPWIYYPDFFLSYGIAVATIVAFHRQLLGPSLWIQAGLFVVSVIALYRATIFIHDIVHIKPGTLSVFKVLWNLLCGFPCMIPSNFYYPHILHHSKQLYGTHEDGEYLPFARLSLSRVLLYVIHNAFIPVMTIVRFLLLVPIGWIHPKLQREIDAKASAMVINPKFRRVFKSKSEFWMWRLQETGVFLYICAAIALLVKGVITWPLILQLYCVYGSIFFINGLRTLVAHRYENDPDKPMTYTGQYLDSLNYPYMPLIGELWAPVGLRFHALHHLFPTMPYHNLAKAHRRLTAALPEDCPYHAASERGLFPALISFFKSRKRYLA